MFRNISYHCSRSDCIHKYLFYAKTSPSPFSMTYQPALHSPSAPLHLPSHCHLSISTLFSFSYPPFSSFFLLLPFSIFFSFFLISSPHTLLFLSSHCDFSINLDSYYYAYCDGIAFNPIHPKWHANLCLLTVFQFLF